MQTETQANTPQYVAATMPSEGFVGIEILINQPPKGNRPGRVGVFGVGRTNFYKLVSQGVIPQPIKLGRKTLMHVDVVRGVIKSFSSPAAQG